MKRIFFTFAFLLLPFYLAVAAPVCSTADVTNGSAVTVASLPFTAAGTNRLLLICPYWNDTALTLSSVTFNSLSATSITSVNNTHGIGAMYRLALGTGTTTDSIEITFSGVADQVTLGAMLCTDVDQTTPVGTSAKAGDFGVADVLATVDVTAPSGKVVAACFTSDQITALASVGGGQTEQFFLGTNHEFSGSTQDGAGTTTVLWTWDGSFQVYSLIAVPVNEVTAVGGVARRRAPIFQ